MRHPFLLFLLVVLGGCNQSHVSLEPWRSGSRLRAIVERTDDGLTRFVTWHDTELDVDCRFANDAEGTLRCMPVATLWNAYVDSTCTTIGHADGPCYRTRGRFVSRPVPAASPCSRRSSYEAIEIDLDAPRDEAFEMAGGSCSASTSVTRTYPILGPVDPTRFVAASIEVRALTARASVEVLVAVDGSQQMTPVVHDAELGSECGFGIDPVELCVPTRSAFLPADASFLTPQFADASCSEQVAMGSSTECGGEPLLARTFSTGCGPSTALYELGAPYTGRVYARQPDGTCSEATAAATLYEVGPAYDTSRLLQATRVVRGDGGVRLSTLELEGHALERSSFVDASDRPCSTYQFPDGSSRCVVVDILITYDVDDFADPACTEPVLTWTPTECSPDPYMRAAVSGSEPAQCLGSSGLGSVHDLTPLPPGPRYRMESGACVEWRVDEGGTDLRLSGPIPIDSLPRITRVME